MTDTWTDDMDLPDLPTGDLDLDDLIDWTAFEDLAVEGINLMVEAPPVEAEKSPRGTGTKEVPWEALFDGLRSHPGIFIRAALFSIEDNGPDYRKKASSRARNMRARLNKVQPTEVWDVKNIEDKDHDLVKIFISYVGKASPELVLERETKAAEAIARGKHAAAVRNAGKSSRE